MSTNPKDYANPREHLRPLRQEPRTGFTVTQGTSGLAAVVTAFLSDEFGGQTIETVARDYEPLAGGGFTFKQGSGTTSLDVDLLGGIGDGTRLKKYTHYAKTVDPLRVAVWSMVHHGWADMACLAGKHTTCAHAQIAMLESVTTHLFAALTNNQK